MPRSFPIRVFASTLALALLAAGCGDSPTQTPAVPARLDIAGGDDQTGTVGEQLGDAIVVKVLDAKGRPVANQLINFRVTAGGGSVFAGSALSNSQGIAQERWTLGTVVGQPQLLEARVVNGETGEPIVLAAFSATAKPGAPTTATPTLGNGQSVGPLGALPIRPTVKLEDKYGNAVPDITVTYAVTAGGGTATGLVVTSDAAGIAPVGSWTVGSQAGPNRLTATIAGLSPVVFTATTTPGIADRLVKEAGDVRSAAVGTAVDVAPVVVLLDAHGNGIPNAPITFAATGGGATGVTSTTTDADGRARAVSWTLGNTAGTQSVTATAGTLSAMFTATARADVPAAFTKVRGDAQQAFLGATVAVAPAVRLADRFGNPIAGAEVRFDVTGGAGTITGATQVTGSDGTATVGSWSVGTTRGAQSLTATTAGFTTTFTASAVSREASRMDWQLVPYWGAGAVVVPKVIARNEVGEPVAGVVVTFRLGWSTHSSTLVGPVDTTDHTGMAAAQSWTLGNLGTYTIIASSPGLPEITREVQVVGAGPAIGFAINHILTTNPTFVILGRFGTYEFYPVDRFGNRAGGVERVLVTQSDARGTHSSRVIASGSGTEFWTAGCAPGTQTLTVMDATDSIPRSSRSFQVVDAVLPPWAIIKVAGDFQVGPAGAALPVRPSVRVEDQCGRALSGVTVSFSRPTPAGPVGESVVTGSDGVATMSEWVLPATPGTYRTLVMVANSIFRPEGSFTATATSPPSP